MFPVYIPVLDFTIVLVETDFTIVVAKLFAFFNIFPF